MNISTIANPFHQSRLAITCVFCVMLNSCVTTRTAYDVQTQPMSADLEKKVLQQTKLSGTLIGAGAGAVVGGVVAGGLVAALGGDGDAVVKAAVGGATLGAVAGGMQGHKAGKQKGEEIAAKGLTRDQLRELESAAREQNVQLARFNTDLKRQLEKVSNEPDPKKKKAAYASLRNQANQTLKNTNERVKMRENALASNAWPANQKNDYRSATSALINERKDLVKSIDRASMLEQSVTY